MHIKLHIAALHIYLLIILYIFQKYSLHFPKVRMNILDIINNTPISPLAISNFELTTNQIGKLDKSKSVMLVDTSYWLYYRFFALRNWYKKAFPDKITGDNFLMEYNWFEDEIFMTKYKKLFIDNIKSLCRKYLITMQNVVFCIDCSYKDIWRNAHTNDYKANRPESLKKKQFNSFNIFSYIKKDYLPELQLKYGIKILYNARCEADDVIGQLSPFLIINGVPNVYIIATDNDYLQICSSRIKMIKGNLSYNYNTDNEKHDNNLEGDRYLIQKILAGDVSDNIKCCSIDLSFINNVQQQSRNTIITNNDNNYNNNITKDVEIILDGKGIFKNIQKNQIQMLLNNDHYYNLFLELLNDIRTGGITSASNSKLIFIKNYYENAILMDFKMLPNKLKEELKHKFTNLLY